MIEYTPTGAEPSDHRPTNASTMQADPAEDRDRVTRPDERRAVVVLAKAPVAGRVKTRLTPPASPQGAAAIAAAALLDTLDAALSVPGARVVVALEGDLADAERAEELAVLLARTTVVRQRGDSLGERIAAAHADTAALFPGAATVQIGMDTPQVDADLLEAAFAAVRPAAGPVAALGLAHDGGWWALALRDPRRASIIEAVPTSLDDTGPRTLDALRAGLGAAAVVDLPPLSDVDTADDAARVSELVPHGRFAHAVGDLLPLPGGVSR